MLNHEKVCEHLLALTGATYFAKHLKNIRSLNLQKNTTG